MELVTRIFSCINLIWVTDIAEQQYNDSGNSNKVSNWAKVNLESHNVLFLDLYFSFYIRGRTIKFANSPPCACRGSTGQRP